MSAAAAPRREMPRASIWHAVHEVFAASGDRPVSNRQLYRAVSQRIGVSDEEFNARIPIGRSGKPHSPMARTARFVQQTMKAKGWLTSVPGQRGSWTLTETGKHRLRRLEAPLVMLGFSTRLGCALWGDSRQAFRNFGEPIHLVLGSPPFALAKPRAYGNVSHAEYVDWLCRVLEPLVAHLAPGGSLTLALTDDLFEPGTPARTLLKERLVLALHERFQLSKMGELILFNKSRPPAPVQWASIHRYQLNCAYEPLLWFTNDPTRVRSDNRRVLEPHTEQHQRLMARGGECGSASYADGSYRRRPGAFGKPTPGRIPRNVLEIGHTCASQRLYKQRARALGLPVHGAPYAKRLSDFLIRFLTEPGDLVADPFGGSQTTAVSAEELGRHWVTCELHAEYVRGGATRFGPETWINPVLDQLLGIERDDQLEFVL